MGRISLTLLANRDRSVRLSPKGSRTTATSAPITSRLAFIAWFTNERPHTGGGKAPIIQRSKDVYERRFFIQVLKQDIQSADKNLPDIVQTQTGPLARKNISIVRMLLSVQMVWNIRYSFAGL